MAAPIVGLYLYTLLCSIRIPSLDGWRLYASGDEKLTFLPFSIIPRAVQHNAFLFSLSLLSPETFYLELFATHLLDYEPAFLQNFSARRLALGDLKYNNIPPLKNFEKGCC